MHAYSFVTAITIFFLLCSRRKIYVLIRRAESGADPHLSGRGAASRDAGEDGGAAARDGGAEKPPEGAEGGGRGPRRSLLHVLVGQVRQHRFQRRGERVSGRRQPGRIGRGNRRRKRKRRPG